MSVVSERVDAWLTRDPLRTLALITAGITLAAMALQLIGAHNLVLANGQPVFGDYLAFWSAGRLALEGHADLVYSDSAIQIAHREALPTLGDMIFAYRHPPPFLLIATPLAALPFPFAAVAFLALSGGLFVFAARKLAPQRGDLLFAAAMPAALLHVGSVQMGLLAAGLTGLAFVWLDRRPLAAGAAIGLLAIKPHLAVLWPMLLALQGRWRAFFAAATTAIAFVLLAGLVFGFDLYTAFFASLPEALSAVSAGQIEKDTLTSLYANLVGLGVPGPLASTAHWASALAGIAIAVSVWRHGDAGLSAAAFVCATLLFSPYLFFYDETLILVAIAALYPSAHSPREKAWLAFAWGGAALSLAAGKILTIPICAIAAWALLLMAAARAGVTPAGIWAALRARAQRT